MKFLQKYCIAYSTKSFLSPGIEPETESQHQVVGVFETIQLIARMQEKMLRNVRLQDKGLIERIVVIPVTEEILANTQIDGKDGHDNFGTQGKTGRELLPERRTVELQFIRVGREIIVGHVISDVGTLIILHIQRNTGTEILAEVVERIEIQSQNTERTRCQYRMRIAPSPKKCVIPTDAPMVFTPEFG